MEHFRCFKDKREIALKPLTFLVGENSTGKTSFLAAVRLCSEIATVGIGVKLGIDFNREPFNLGAYDQIASFAGGKGGRAKFFIIGYEKEIGKENQPHIRLRLEARFEQQKSQPILTEVSVIDLNTRISQKANLSPDRKKITLIQNNGLKDSDSAQELTALPLWPELSMMGFWKYWVEVMKENDQTKASEAVAESLLQFSFGRQSFYAIAPVRTKPERTYDPKTDIPQPEGNHIPVTLRQITTKQNKWRITDLAINEYGNRSGLFKEIMVRPLGGEADPFQIRVKIAGSPNNLIDVGYGVSQVLPVLVDATVREEQVILLQQPEVHLHPRAQAELGTYLAFQTKNREKQFLIETHSDYMIDRVCLDIRDKKNDLSPEDVVILFFQRIAQTPWIRIIPINIDEKGNIVNPPRGYRDFFLKEQARLFGV